MAAEPQGAGTFGAQCAPVDAAALALGAVEVAPRLLGTVIASNGPEGMVSVAITEVEAYEGAADPGSHAYRGRTERNATMFAAPGHLYAYRHMGLHTCLNVVARPEGEGAAVLLRAGRVIVGTSLARVRRVARRAERGIDTGRAADLPDAALARGPANLAVCLGLTVGDDGANLLSADGPVRLMGPNAPGQGAIRRGPRVGIAGPGGDGAVFPWRWWVDGEASVSAYRRAASSAPPPVD
jgi:DNA-3-methyladenine glycosylase